MLPIIILLIGLAIGIPAAVKIFRNYQARLLINCECEYVGLRQAIDRCRDRWELKKIQGLVRNWEISWVEKIDRGAFNKMLDVLNKEWIARREYIRKAA